MQSVFASAKADVTRVSICTCACAQWQSCDSSLDSADQSEPGYGNDVSSCTIFIPLLASFPQLSCCSSDCTDHSASRISKRNYFTFPSPHTLKNFEKKSDKMSQVRQNYHADSEEGVNKQINLELYAMYTYMSLVRWHMWCD